MKLPIKGKDIKAISSDGQERYLFRCNCTDEKCLEWRCSITGLSIITEVINWKYCSTMNSKEKAEELVNQYRMILMDEDTEFEKR